MSALTLLIWERCDFSSSRSSSSRCAFFMASMAAGVAQVSAWHCNAQRAELDRASFLFVCFFNRNNELSQPSKPPHCSAVPSAQCGKEILQMPLFNEVQKADQFTCCFLNCRTPNAETPSALKAPMALNEDFVVGPAMNG